MLAYGFLKSETTGASIFAPPVTPSSAQYALGNTHIKRTKPGQDIPREAKRGGGGGGWGCSFQQHQVREIILTAGFGRYGLRQAQQRPL